MYLRNFYIIIFYKLKEHVYPIGIQTKIFSNNNKSPKITKAETSEVLLFPMLIISYLPP